MDHDVTHQAMLEVWEAALASTWAHPPVWVHGDITPSNLLVQDGRLRAVIDFGCMATGDPACDLTIAWTLFEGESRDAFEEVLAMDSDTWTRARGWALCKALKTCQLDRQFYPNSDRSTSERFGWRTSAWELVDHIVNDPRR
jgi:aminoglycoside phosphotransferase (APT) family kinase protein